MRIPPAQSFICNFHSILICLPRQPDINFLAKFRQIFSIKEKNRQVSFHDTLPAFFTTPNPRGYGPVCTLIVAPI